MAEDLMVCACLLFNQASKPDDWDDEEDGEWEAPLIDNPEFKGEWKPKMIPNPDYKVRRRALLASFLPDFLGMDGGRR